MEEDHHLKLQHDDNGLTYLDSSASESLHSSVLSQSEARDKAAMSSNTSALDYKFKTPVGKMAHDFARLATFIGATISKTRGVAGKSDVLESIESKNLADCNLSQSFLSTEHVAAEKSVDETGITVQQNKSVQMPIALNGDDLNTMMNSSNTSPARLEPMEGSILPIAAMSSDMAGQNTAYTAHLTSSDNTDKINTIKATTNPYVVESYTEGQTEMDAKPLQSEKLASKASKQGKSDIGQENIRPDVPSTPRQFQSAKSTKRRLRNSVHCNSQIKWTQESLEEGIHQLSKSGDHSWALQKRVAAQLSQKVLEKKFCFSQEKLHHNSSIENDRVDRECALAMCLIKTPHSSGIEMFEIQSQIILPSCVSSSGTITRFTNHIDVWYLQNISKN